mgnify:FL=1|jgi:hypothetical protein
MKKPRSWVEALQHPGIASIDDERPFTERIEGYWIDCPFIVYLNDGWNWDGLNHFGISGFKELQQEFNHISLTQD